MKTQFKNFFILSISLSLFFGTSTKTWAANCQSDISAVDAKIREQYGGDYSKWWTWFACPVCIGGQLRKDAIVSKAQIQEISSHRNLAYMQLRHGNEKQCRDELRTAKRLLRIS